MVAAEPSKSFIFKGTDIPVTSLVSELRFLMNPVASHVQTAEMGNKVLNSLALISARYTLGSLEILSQLSAAHLVTVCQTLDLSALNIRFLEVLEPELRTLIRQDLHRHLISPEGTEALLDTCWKVFTARLEATTSLHFSARLSEAITNLQLLIIPSLRPKAIELKALKSHTEHLTKRAVDLIRVIREQYLINGNTTTMLGRTSKRVYTYIRKDLRIPFVGPETLRTSSCPAESGREVTMGALNGKVRAAMADGRMNRVVIGCIRDVEKRDRLRRTAHSKH